LDIAFLEEFEKIVDRYNKKFVEIKQNENTKSKGNMDVIENEHIGRFMVK